MVTKLGLLFFCGAAAVLVGRVVYPGLVSNEVLPVALVLIVMGGIAGFPEQFFKLVNPRLENITNELQSHLTQIGVDSEILDPKGPGTIKHKPPVFGNDPLYVPPWGVVRVKNRNVEFVELRVRVVPGAGGRGRRDATGIQYVCAVQGNIGNEDEYRASTGGGGVWSGGRLAEVLNSDNELRTMLTGMGHLPITVRGVKSDGYVAIYKEGLGTQSRDSMVPTFGMGDYPSADEFKVYDRIAGHVKEMLG